MPANLALPQFGYFFLWLHRTKIVRRLRRRMFTWHLL